MTRDQIIETVKNGGYICKVDYRTTAEVYDHNGQHVGCCPCATMERIANMDEMTKWVALSDTEYVGKANTGKAQDHENTIHCKRIADDIDDYVCGRVVRCPECGEIITIDDDREKHLCKCGYIDDVDEFEQLGIYDYLDDILDIEYRVDREKELKSVQICIAWGGPSIYLDTASQKVELYWWFDRADWPLSNEAVEAIDEWAEEYYRY